MAGTFSRRQFLRLASLAMLAPFTRYFPANIHNEQFGTSGRPNIILLIFDALSALNLSLYGYPRRTSPNMERFARRATVYHNHHSAGNFTTPSTASLFTGTYPWTHRAFSLSGLVTPALVPNNLFGWLKGEYHQAVFTQNLYADMLLYQFEKSLDEHLPMDSFNLAGHTLYNHFFRNDAVAGLKSFDLFLFQREQAHGSLILSLLNDLELQHGMRMATDAMVDQYPDGLPRLANTDVYFSFSQLIDGVMDFISHLPQPFFAYIHLIPPHAPYRPIRQFINTFADGWNPVEKKRHPLAPHLPQERMNEQRQIYDEYVANVDEEFGRLYDHLQVNGVLDNSYLILTSDHGEAFERGVIGHSTPLVLEPGIHVPLVISAPGQTQHQDIRSLTSTVDLLPTLAEIAGLPTPAWGQGLTLPGFSASQEFDRGINVIEAKRNPAHQVLDKATVCLIKGPYKLVHFLGYRYGRDDYEFYDLENDPEEMNDQYASHPAVQDLKHELDQQLAEANQPYIH